jgi:protoporphyrinogen/coproporphyrinogen III oxidase
MSKKRLVVIGGGISGLAAAHRLLELGRERDLSIEVTLLEAGDRVGGVILTERKDGFVIEAGPDSFITEKPSALRLCERLGLTARLISTNPNQRGVYVVHRGSLEPLPDGFILLAPTRLWPLLRTPLFSWRGKLRMAIEPFIRPTDSSGDVSLASFVRRRFGREVLERVAQPLVGGIYAADPEKLSLEATMPRFLAMERKYRSVTRALWHERRRSRTGQQGSGARWTLFVSPAGGMQDLVEAVGSRLPSGTVRLSSEVTRLTWEEAGRSWRITAGREDVVADGVILAIPAFRAAALLSSLAPKLAQKLQAIPYSSSATVSLAFGREEVPHPLDGFGVVVPAVERRKIIACTFTSVKYSGRAPSGHVLLRAFVGGALQADLLEQDDQSLEAGVRQEMAALLGIKARPLFSRIYRHPASLPQYYVGHLEVVKRIEHCLADCPGLELAGNAYRGVGVSDCVRSGEEAAERLLATTQT